MIDMKLTYQTRDGRPVRLLCTDGPLDYPVVGLIDGDIGATSWTRDGVFYDSGVVTEIDLIEVKPKIVVERWINIVKSKQRGISALMYCDKAIAEIADGDVYEQVLARAISFKWEGEEV